MPEPMMSLAAENVDVLYATERRRSPRLPVPDLVVGLELPEVVEALEEGTAALRGASTGFAWIGSAIDISLDGMSLALPDDIPLGSEVLLTFKLDADTACVRVPAIVVRRKPGFGQGAVLFLGWDLADSQALRAYIDER